MYCVNGHVFDLPRDLARLRDLKHMQLYGKGPFQVSHHPSTFGGYNTVVVEIWF